MIQCQVNGVQRSFDGDPGMPLLWYLRDRLQLTGTKYGCGIGLCGACTVHDVRCSTFKTSAPRPREENMAADGMLTPGAAGRHAWCLLTPLASDPATIQC